MRKLVATDLVIIDDFALQGLDPTETSDFYALVVERHRRASTVLTSDRDPSEWLALMADPMLAQSAIDRLQSAAFELVVEGESYRRRKSRPYAHAGPTGTRLPHDQSQPREPLQPRASNA